MSLSSSRDHESGSSAQQVELAFAHPSLSPEQPSFTSFPGGEGATHPDIPSEPMLTSLYNKVLSLASSGKSTPAVMPHQEAPLGDAKPRVQEGPTSMGISMPSSHQSKNATVTSFTGVETESGKSQLEKVDTTVNRQSMIRSEKSPDVLAPVVSPINAVGDLTRSEDEFSAAGSDKPTAEKAKQSAKAQLREINLPGLASFRLTREPSSDSESVSSHTAHPGRTIKSIIGRLRTGDLGREFWMKDETSHECFLCGEKFTSKFLLSQLTECSISSKASLQDLWTDI